MKLQIEYDSEINCQHIAQHASQENNYNDKTHSHQLMLRAWMIRKLASGLYTWLPMGTRVLKKVDAIGRDDL